MALTNKKEAELQYLKKRCIIFNEYFYEKYGKLDMYKNAIQVFEKEFENQNLIGLRHANKDMNNWLREMPIKDAMELGEILKKELGEDIELIEKKRLKAIDKILKRGKINNLDEYKLLHTRVEEIYDKPDKIVELEQMNNLLSGYGKHE